MPLRLICRLVLLKNKEQKASVFISLADIHVVNAFVWGLKGPHVSSLMTVLALTHTRASVLLEGNLSNNNTCAHSNPACSYSISYADRCCRNQVAAIVANFTISPWCDKMLFHSCLSECLASREDRERVKTVKEREIIKREQRGKRWNGKWKWKWRQRIVLSITGPEIWGEEGRISLPNSSIKLHTFPNGRWRKNLNKEKWHCEPPTRKIVRISNKQQHRIDCLDVMIEFWRLDFVFSALLVCLKTEMSALFVSKLQLQLLLARKWSSHHPVLPHGLVDSVHNFSTRSPPSPTLGVATSAKSHYLWVYEVISKDRVKRTKPCACCCCCCLVNVMSASGQSACVRAHVSLLARTESIVKFRGPWLNFPPNWKFLRN